MKTFLTVVFLLAAVATGCVSDHQNIVKPAPVRPAPPAPPPVTANQVSSENAHAVSQALWDEMDREAQNEPVNAPVSQSSPAKK